MFNAFAPAACTFAPSPVALEGSKISGRRMTNEQNLGELTLRTDKADGAVVVHWIGRSTSATPGDAIVPLLLAAADDAAVARARLVFAFEALEFFNSATITVLLRTIRSLRGKPVTLTLRYDDSKRWQRTFFDAFAGVGLAEGDDVLIEAIRG